MRHVNLPAAAALRVIDSHTGGEPTRVVVEGAPPLGGGDMRSRREALRTQADWVRTSLTLEPRAAPWVVGAVLQEAVDPTCVAGVVFFNNTGYLGMCGHGLVGVVTTLAYLGRIEPGVHRLETPAGVVSTTLLPDGSVSFENVLSYCSEQDVVVEAPGLGLIVGDVAYGGNWFFLTRCPALDASRITELTEHTIQIKAALYAQGICGEQQEIDHIELTGPPGDKAEANARNFVLCPGNQFDRSPCGTGTSAKLACLAARGELAPGEKWIQESILGSVFEGSYRPVEGGIIPTIRGRAFVTGETSVIIDPQDPFRHGFDPLLPVILPPNQRT